MRGFMSNELTVDLAAATKEFAAQNAVHADSPAAEHAPTGINPEPIQSIDSDIEVPDSPFWSSEEQMFPDVKGSKPKQKAEVAAAAPKVNDKLLTYKANGKEHQLDLSNPQHMDIIKKRLAEADGMSKAFAKAAKAEQRLKEREAELEQARKYKESWDKLEQIRHDKAKMVELLTGESYEDFVKREAEKRQIMELGTEEEKQLVRQQDRIKDLETRLQLFEERTRREAADAEARAQKAAEAEDRARNEQFKANIEREFFKNVDDSVPDDLKQLIYQKTILDLKGMYKQYGQVTNKMVSKAMADNARRLKSFKEEAVNTEVNKALENTKQAATAKAQAASTKNYENDVEGINLASLSPDKLFQYLKFQNRKSK
jgi:hypothetical protein